MYRVLFPKSNNNKTTSRTHIILELKLLEMKKKVLSALIISLMACSQSILAQTEASSFTKEKNDQVKKYLPFDNKDDFRDATRGFIGTIDEPVIKNEDGTVAYDLAGWNFLDSEAPATVNPSLWRQSQLNKIHGLYEVLPGKIYQIRGFDLANMSFVRTDNGWVIIDVMTSKSVAKAGYDLVKKHLGDLPVKAVIFTHPHMDHFAGIDAILEGAPNKDVEIIAPDGFFEHAISENTMAGIAMGRRSLYMYGVLLPKAERGTLGSGLGQVNAMGQQGNAVPTVDVKATGEKLTVDGLEMEFVFAEATEAPTEIMVYFPQYKAFCTAEEINHNLHNLITLRGAQVRNGLKWSKAIDEAIRLYGDKTEVSFGTHHWPTWGNKAIVEYWENQRDIYRYIHDQVLRLANSGYTPNEISEMIKLPESLDKQFYNRGYYGTVSHDAKAQYQLYFGWFDGNPANLHTLPPTELGVKYVEAMGGAKKVLKIAQASYDAGEYRWVATLLNNLVFAQPDNKPARELLAKTFDQLGYQAESGPWRNFYLTGAQELRQGANKEVHPMNSTPETLALLGLGDLLDLLAIQIDGEKAASQNFVMNLNFKDNGEKATMILKNGALTNRIGTLATNPTTEITINKIDFVKVMLKITTLEDLVKADKAMVKGIPSSLSELIKTMEKPDKCFNIVEP